VPAQDEALNLPSFMEQAEAAFRGSPVTFEVVVIDDGSTDDTAAIVARRYLREPRVRLIRQRNGGKAAALRTGVAACRTEVIVALDADTLFAASTVRRLIEPFCDARVGAVAGTAEVGNVDNVCAFLEPAAVLLCGLAIGVRGVGHRLEQHAAADAQRTQS